MSGSADSTPQTEGWAEAAEATLNGAISEEEPVERDRLFREAQLEATLAVVEELRALREVVHDGAVRIAVAVDRVS